MQGGMSLSNNTITNVSDVILWNGSSCCSGAGGGGSGDNTSWNQNIANSLYVLTSYSNVTYDVELINFITSDWTNITFDNEIANFVTSAWPNITFLNKENNGNINVSAGKDVCISGGNCLSNISGSSGTSTGTISSTNFMGSDLSGSDGAKARTLNGDADFITVDNSLLHPVYDYSELANVITFNIKVWDDQQITVFNATGWTYTNYIGSNCDSTDGLKGRKLTTANAKLIALDNSQLQPDIDYTASATEVTFLIKVYDNQIITVWKG